MGGRPEQRRLASRRSAASTLWIQPKVDIDRILFLLGYAKNQAGATTPSRSSKVDRTWSPRSPTRSLTKPSAPLEPGLLQGYVEVDDSLTVLRGRYVSKTSSAGASASPSRCSSGYDDYTADIAENQLLAAATELLLAPARGRRARPERVSAASAKTSPT